jgi:hypothetical protein
VDKKCVQWLWIFPRNALWKSCAGNVDEKCYALNLQTYAHYNAQVWWRKALVLNVISAYPKNENHGSQFFPGMEKGTQKIHGL